MFIVSAGKKESFDVAPDPDSDQKSGMDWGGLRGRQRGEKVVEAFLGNRDWADIDTIVIPGCGSSPLGAAALAKSVAEINKTKGSDKAVAAIVAGQGAFDQWMEATSGGMLMAPMANVLNTFDPLLELTSQVNPVGARFYVNDLLDAIHEAATLHSLLMASLVEGTSDNAFDQLEMIVSHSKGNWAVLVALLALELDLPELERKGLLQEQRKRISVVTFGNPVELPDMHPTMKTLFHYHQFVGELDKLAHNCSMRAWKLHFGGSEQLDPHDPTFDPEADPDERMVAGTEHHLFAKIDSETGEERKPYHMPIERILQRIRQH